MNVFDSNPPPDDELASLEARLKKAVPPAQRASAPEGYFEGLADRVLERASDAGTIRKLKAHNTYKRIWVSMAVAASIALLVGFWQPWASTDGDINAELSGTTNPTSPNSLALTQEEYELGRAIDSHLVSHNLIAQIAKEDKQPGTSTADNPNDEPTASTVDIESDTTVTADDIEDYLLENFDDPYLTDIL